MTDRVESKPKLNKDGFPVGYALSEAEHSLYLAKQRQARPKPKAKPKAEK